MERFEKNNYSFSLVLQKTPSLIFERVLNMSRVLSMSNFWIFVNIRKYDRDTIMEEFWIFQDSEYAWFLYMQALQKVLNIA